MLAATLLAALACATPVPPGVAVAPVGRRPPAVDILDYEIQLAVDHRAGFVSGSVSVEFSALPESPADSLLLDAVELAVTAARDSQGNALGFELGPTTVEVHLAHTLAPGETEIVTLDYSAYPRLGLHFVGPTAAAPDRPWHVWTQGQAEDTRHWMPVWDQPDERASHTLLLSVDDELVTLGAGRLVGSRHDPTTGRRTDTWRMDTPHVSYLTTFVAGELAQGSLGDDPVPLPVLATAGELPRALENAAGTAGMLTFFGALTGIPYPYAKYAQVFVHDYTAGGMENISATTLYSEGLHDPADRPQMRIDDLLAHEAAHQWFGDLLSADGWGEIWLNEGFADWATSRWIEHVQGGAAMAATLLEWRATYMATELADSRPIVWHRYEHPDDCFDEHAYSGGALRLHLLRDQLGAPLFDLALRTWVERYAGELVTTAGLQATFEEVTGLDLSLFFDEWLRGPGFPRFRVRVRPAAGDGHPVLVARQAQDDTGWRRVFHVEVAVAWSRGGVEHKQRLRCDGPFAELPLGGEGPLDWVRFDADTAVPAEVHMSQPLAHWVAQLARAADPVTRLVAARWLAGDTWLRGLGDPEGPLPAEAWPELLSAARADPFTDVRVAALAALAPTEAPELSALCLELAGDEHAEVREAAVAILGARFPEAGLETVLAATGDDNASVVYAALEALVHAGHPEALRRVLATAGSTDRLRLARDLVSLAASIDDPRVLPFLMRTARTHGERWVRAAAVTALGEHDGPFAEPVFRQLCASLGEASYNVRVAAAHALGARAAAGDGRATTQLLARRDIEAHRSVLLAIDGALSGVE